MRLFFALRTVSRMRTHRCLCHGARGAALVLLASSALGLAGCGGQRCIEVANQSPAMVSITESALSASLRAGRGVGTAVPQTFAGTSVFTALDLLAPDASTPQTNCVGLNFAGTGPEDVGVTFDCPPGPGSFRLDDLHAMVCDTSCGPISGTLTVRKFALSCGTGACGRLDADVAVSPSPGSAGPAVTGGATLAYSESVLPSSCGGTGWPGGG